MKVSIKYHEVMEELLRKELEWLREEFKKLFRSKLIPYTEMDKKTANDILDYFLDTTQVNDSFILLNLLVEGIENIEKTYPLLLSAR